MNLEWFVYRSIPKLPGPFASAFWTSILIQTGSTEPAVLHAVLALSSIHKRLVLGPQSVTAGESNNEEACAVYQYNKSIRSLQPHFRSGSKTSTYVTLLTCAVFVHLENLRGHHQAGLTHLRHGLSLIDEILSHPSQSDWIIDDWVVKCLKQLYVQARLFGQSVRWPWQKIPDLHSDLALTGFRSNHQAREQLEDLFIQIFQLSDAIQPQHKNDAIHSELQDRQAWQHAYILIQERLLSWLDAHKVTTEAFRTSSSVIPAMQIFGLRLLRIFHTLATTMLHASLPRDAPQLCRGNQKSCFVSILKQTVGIYQLALKEIVPATPNDPTAQPEDKLATCGIGTITALYCTAVNCKNHRIRLQSLKLLRNTPHREGIWNSLLAARIAAEIIHLEEQDSHSTTKEPPLDDFEVFDMPDEQDVMASLEPPERFWIRELYVTLPEHPKGRLVLSGWKGDDKATGRERVVRECDLSTGTWNDGSCNVSKFNQHA